MRSASIALLVIRLILAEAALARADIVLAYLPPVTDESNLWAREQHRGVF